MKTPIKFHVDPSGGNRADGCCQTYIMKVMDGFCDFVNVRKNCRIRSAAETSELNNIQSCSTHILQQKQVNLHCSSWMFPWSGS